MKLHLKNIQSSKDSSADFKMMPSNSELPWYQLHKIPAKDTKCLFPRGSYGKLASLEKNQVCFGSAVDLIYLHLDIPVVS